MLFLRIIATKTKDKHSNNILIARSHRRNIRVSDTNISENRFQSFPCENGWKLNQTKNDWKVGDEDGAADAHMRDPIYLCGLEFWRERVYKRNGIDRLCVYGISRVSPVCNVRRFQLENSSQGKLDCAIRCGSHTNRRCRCCSLLHRNSILQFNYMTMLPTNCAYAFEKTKHKKMLRREM